MNMQTRILGIAALALVLAGCQVPPLPVDPVDPDPAGQFGLVMLNHSTFDEGAGEEGTFVNGFGVFAEHMEELPEGFLDDPFAQEIGMCFVDDHEAPIGEPFDPNEPFEPGTPFPFADVGATLDAGQMITIFVDDQEIDAFFQRQIVAPEPDDEIPMPFIWYNLITQNGDFDAGFDNVSLSIPGADFPGFDVDMPTGTPVVLLTPEPDLGGTWPVDADTVYTWDVGDADNGVVFITIQTFEDTFITCIVDDADGEFVITDTDFQVGEGFTGWLAGVGRMAWSVETDDDATLMLMTTSHQVYTTTPDEGNGFNDEF